MGVDTVPTPPSALPADTLMQMRPSWPYGDLRPTWRSVVVCALLPAVAGFAGLLVPFGVEAIAVLAIAGFVLGQVGRVPVISVTEDQVRVGEDGATPLTVIPVAAVTDLELVDTAGAQVLLDGDRPDDRLDTAAYRAHPPEPELRHPAAPAGLLLTTATSDASRRRRRRRRPPRATARVLLPVWLPEDGVPLLRAVATATGRLDAAAVARSWPGASAEAVGATPRLPLVPALRRCAAPLAAIVGATVLTILVVLHVTRLVRAATLDAVLGTWLGTGLIFVYRLLTTVAVTAVVATALVAVVALLAWTRVDQPVPPVDVLRLGWLRSRWGLWQLRVWLPCVAFLLTVTGVGGARLALAYIATSGAVPLTQAVHDLVRRTVEEAATLHPPALREVSLWHQWLAGAAAVGVLIYRSL